MFDLIVVSVFGREHWLAVAAKDLGLKVALIDVSEQMGNWAPEDWEGPFGFYTSDRRPALMNERFVVDEAMSSVEKGLTILLADGPIELKGPTTASRLKGLGFHSEEIENFQRTGQFSVSRRELSFDRIWLPSLLQKWSTSVYFDHTVLLTGHAPAGFGNPFYVRQSSRQSLKKSLEWCESKGVQVYSKATVHDLSMVGGKELRALEIQHERREVLHGSQFLWGLSSEETSMLKGSCLKKLFPKGVIESEWSWIRHRMKFSDSEVRAKLPLHFLLLGDRHLRWVFENLLIVQRTSSLDLFDVWQLIPTHQRFSKPYLIERGQAASQLLESRFPETQVGVQDQPQESLYTYHEMGPPRHPVFNPQSIKYFRNREFKNVIFDGPEHWDYLGWEGALQYQPQALNQIEKRWLNFKEKQKRESTNELRS